MNANGGARDNVAATIYLQPCLITQSSPLILYNPPFPFRPHYRDSEKITTESKMAEPIPAGTSIELPILDISNPEDPAVGEAMLDAATKYGFLYVDSKGTDFTAEDVRKAFERVRISTTPMNIQKANVF